LLRNRFPSQLAAGLHHGLACTGAGARQRDCRAAISAGGASFGSNKATTLFLLYLCPNSAQLRIIDVQQGNSAVTMQTKSRDEVIAAIQAVLDDIKHQMTTNGRVQALSWGQKHRTG
jgi:hypothetical protein